MVVKNYTDEFDPNYYMNKYPDIKSAFGTNTCDLFTHYQNFGIKEGRFPSYNVEKQTQLSNPTFSQNYIKYNDFKIQSTSNSSEIKSKKFDTGEECRSYCNDLEECSGFTRNKRNNNCHFFSGDVYPTAGTMQEASNRNTFVRERINNTVCDAECQRQKKLKTLEEKYQRSLYNYQSAPENLKNAKKKYIIFKNGEPYYQDLYERELTKRINKTIRKLFEENFEQAKSTNESIDDFKQKYNIYNNHLNNYLINVSEGNKVFQKKLYDSTTEKELDARKSYYQLNEKYNIEWYSIMFTRLYVILLIIYLVLFIINGAYTKGSNIVLALVFLAYPYIWYYIIMKYVMYLFNLIYFNLPKDVYYDI